jgi:hypothetical protein
MRTFLGQLSAQQLSFPATLFATFGLLMTEWLRDDIVALLIVLALAITPVRPLPAMTGARRVASTAAHGRARPPVAAGRRRRWQPSASASPAMFVG